ncbi:hypothetical protein SEUCBS140593_004644 [Sporothrix eucalyptigena]|uniref:Metallo-beta-lactamase domain-containing protein n=1 Tax=Sporothrix eucalyptigena TaxID=1812306 RepID=A0ABP0BQF5_9PEZI
MLESNWEERELLELKFNSDLKVGQFRDIDYFNDGRFCLLDAPGHAIGHTCALAPVTKADAGANDTFVFMAGDTCHTADNGSSINAILPISSLK